MMTVRQRIEAYLDDPTAKDKTYYGVSRALNIPYSTAHYHVKAIRADRGITPPKAPPPYTTAIDRDRKRAAGMIDAGMSVEGALNTIIMEGGTRFDPAEFQGVSA